MPGTPPSHSARADSLSPWLRSRRRLRLSWRGCGRRIPCSAVSAQGGECLGDGLAHEREGRAVCGEAAGIGPAPVQRRCYARDERGVIGKPAVHVSYALDREPLTHQRRLQLCQLRVPSLSDSRET